MEYKCKFFPTLDFRISLHWKLSWYNR